MNSRLFEIIYYLLNTQQTNAKQLAEHFEVSVRTIYRDLDKLLVAGIPVVTQQGVGGGIYIDEDFVFDKSLLQQQEQDDILAALQSLSSLQVNEYNELLSRMQKIFQKEGQNWIEIDFSSWNQNEDMNSKFEFLRNSILNKKTVYFDYINAKGHKSRKLVYPIKIIFKSLAWYLQAFDFKSGSYKVYKLSRMGQVKESQKKVDINCISEDIPVLNYQESSYKVDVKLRFKKYLGSFVYDEFAHDTIEETDNYYIVKAQISYGRWFVSFILSLGSGVEVMEPVSIRQEVINELNNNLKQYL